MGNKFTPDSAEVARDRSLFASSNYQSVREEAQAFDLDLAHARFNYGAGMCVYYYIVDISGIPVKPECGSVPRQATLATLNETCASAKPNGLGTSPSPIPAPISCYGLGTIVKLQWMSPVPPAVRARGTLKRTAGNNTGQCSLGMQVTWEGPGKSESSKAA
ncbi:hypothetical protein RJ55_02820 [Drechmeria coniospora]|nr:hypothetical protein RJ55_02820 [Drechmeria coniospora]